MRLGKGTTKTKEGPVQRPVTSTGDIKPPKTGEPTDAASFLKRLSDAEDERKQAQRELETNSDGSKSYLQHQAQKRRNNPDLDARLTAADTAITTATNNLTDFRARAQEAEKPKPEPTKPEAPKPEPQRTEPVDTAPKRQPEEPAKPEVSSPVTPKPQRKKEKKPVEISNGQLPQE
jgi:chromosome segregation ATPase